MFHHIKKFLAALLVLIVGVPMVYGFATIEPYESWQLVTYGYGTPLDSGGPANIGSRFRWNLPTIYYACDASFLQYFGVNGQAEVDKAFAYYTSLTNLSAINPLSFPDNTSKLNGTAFALDLVDLRSVTMSRIIRFLGLIEPDRYTWCLYNRFLLPNTTCPNGEQYVVVQRNFDPVTYEYSSYVDGLLYTYAIAEGCTTTPIVALAQAIPVDPVKSAERAVADGIDYINSGKTFGSSGPVLGRYYTGLTKDDIGGLKNLMGVNQFINESAPNGAVLISTNNGTQLVTTSDLASFLSQAKTNSPAVLQALYPALNIVSSTSYFTNTIVTNVTGFYTTNYPFAPAGVIQFVPITNYTIVPQTNYSYVFGNLQIIHAYSNQFVSTVTDQLVPQPFAPAGFYTEQINTSTTSIAGTNGDFYIIPTNLCGAFQIVSTQAVTVVTNLVTLPLGVFNGNFGQTFTISIQQATYFTNYTYLANSVQCTSNNVAVRGGVDKLNFVRHDYDSLFSTFWSPVTSTFQVVEVVNNVVTTNTYVRTVTQPDMLMSTAETITGPANNKPFLIFLSNFNFDTSHATAQNQGPGLINPQQTLYFGKSGGLIEYNNGPGTQGTATLLTYQWATYDGTTNLPVIYPNGTSISNLAPNLRFQITNSTLANYTLTSHYTAANPFSVTLGVTGGVSPYTWSVPTNSPGGLPPNLMFTNVSGVEYIQGAGPTNAPIGTTYDFYIQAKDSTGAIAFKSLFLVVNP